MDEEDITLVALLERIRGWELQKKKLQKEAVFIQRRIKEANNSIDEILDEKRISSKN